MFSGTLCLENRDLCTPLPLYNTIVVVQANFHVNYAIIIRIRIKCRDYITINN